MSSFSSSLSSSTSSSANTVKSVKKAEIAGWINEWVENIKSDRFGTIQAIRRVFTEDEFKEHVSLMDKQQLVMIMVQCLSGKFITGVTTNSGRVEAIVEVLEVIDNNGKDEQQEEIQEDEVEVEVEEKDEDSPPGTPSPRPNTVESSTTTVTSHTKSPRKTKSVAKQRISEQVSGTTELLQQFANKAGGLSKYEKKVKSLPSKPANKKIKKKLSARRIKVVGGDPDSSDGDSNSSDSSSDTDSSINSSSSSDDSDDGSSTDSDVGSVDNVRFQPRRSRIRREKKKSGYKLAKQIYSISSGHVHRYLSRYEWKNKRNGHEVDTLTRVFDYRMAHQSNLWDKDVRLLALRIAAVQAQDCTGSWQVAEQFAMDPMNRVILSKKQLSRAAKQAAELQRILVNSKVPLKSKSNEIDSAPSSSPFGYSHYDSGALNYNSYSNENQGYRPPKVANKWRNDRFDGNRNNGNGNNNAARQVPSANSNSNNSNNNNNRAASGAGSSNTQ
jgi:hypothetical protein